MENKSHLFERIIPFFLIIISTIIIIFIAQVVIQLKGELQDIKTTLTDLQNEKVTNAKFEPFKVLEDNCTSCHSERKYSMIHGQGEEITKVLNYMEKMPDAHISLPDLDKIHGSLTLLQCIRCHDENQIKMLGALNASMQREYIERMTKKSGSGIVNEDVSKIQKALLQIQGF